MISIVLTVYDWFLGTAEIAAVFLSLVAGVIALSLFKVSRKNKELAAWKPLIIALVLFAVEETIGALKTFGVYTTPHLTHVVPGFVLAFLIASLVMQIHINRGFSYG
ncbi:hypothetical protein JW707_01880 [Candidatus Woesearchaeota archaeon]|nr:hypothetical protein [Candidatus Woesearchaeota archaeon]